MTRHAPLEQGGDAQRVTKGLWLALVVPPMAWFLDLGVSYGLAAGVCDGGPAWPIHTSTLAASVATGASLVHAWRLWREGRRARDAKSHSGDPARFLSVAAVAGSAYFLLIILASAVPPLVGAACP